MLSESLSIAALVLSLLSLALHARRRPAAAHDRLEELALASVQAAEARYGAGNGQDKARFARQALLDHAAAHKMSCTALRADALIHTALARGS